MSTRSVAAKAADIKPGDLVAVDIGANRIAIANTGGQFFAIDDTCTHEQCSLAEGTLEGAVVTCPCHGAQFDVRTGQVVTPPAVEPIRTYPLQIDRGDLVIEV